MTVEEVYTNAFDNTYVAWVEVGSSPYLHASDADYIDKLTSKTTTYKEGNWSFPNSAGSGTITSVKLRFEVKRSDLLGDDLGVTVYVWNGASWISVGILALDSTSYAWEEIDVSSILDTWAKINGAKVYLRTTNASAKTCTLYVRRCTRKVDYTGGGVTGWRKLQYLTEPQTAGAFNKLKYAVEPPVVGAWNKLLYSNE